MYHRNRHLCADPVSHSQIPEWARNPRDHISNSLPVERSRLTYSGSSCVHQVLLVLRPLDSHLANPSTRLARDLQLVAGIFRLTNLLILPNQRQWLPQLLPLRPDRLLQLQNSASVPHLLVLSHRQIISRSRPRGGQHTVNLDGWIQAQAKRQGEHRAWSLSGLHPKGLIQ